MRGHSRNRAGNWRRLAGEQAGLLPGVPEPGPTKRLPQGVPRSPPPEGYEEWSLPPEWAAVRCAELPGTYRFFARLREFDYACPRCGELYLIRHSKRSNRDKVRCYSSSHDTSSGTYDPILSRMTCKICHLKVTLGVMAYPVPTGPPVPPDDVVTTMSEELKLRAARMGGIWEPSRVAEKGTVINRLVRKKEGK